MPKARKNKKTWYIKYIVIGLFLVFPLFSITTVIFINKASGGKQAAYFSEVFLKSKYDIISKIETVKYSNSIFEFHNVDIFDHKEQVFAHIDKVKVNIRGFRQTPGKVIIRELDLENANIEARQYSTDEFFNFQYLIWKMQADSNSGKSQKKILFKKIGLKGGNLHYKLPSRNNEYGIINWEDFKIHDIYAVAYNVENYATQIQMAVDTLYAIEQNGLVFTDMKSDISVDTNLLAFNNTLITTEKSKLSGSVIFHFHGWQDFSNFIQKVRMEGDIYKSNINMDDLKYFTQLFETNEKRMLISGLATGTVDNLRCSNMDVFFGYRSRFKGDVSFNGLPDIPETFMDVKATDFEFSLNDINRLVPEASIPEVLLTAQLNGFKGRFTGFVNDFVTYGKAYSGEGIIESDLNFKINPQSKVPTYSGKIKLTDFDMGKFLEKSTASIGKISMSGKVSGSGINLNDVKTDLDAHADYIEFNNYAYKNLDFDGYMEKKIFMGDLNVSDPNFNIAFNGKIDFTGDVPHFKFNSAIKRADFYALHFVNDSLTLNGYLDLNLMGESINELTGKILLLNAGLKTTGNEYPLKTLLVSSEKTQDGKSIELKSDLAEASLKGNYNLLSLTGLFETVFSGYLDPSFGLKQHPDIVDQELKYSILLRKTSFINELLDIPVVFGNNTSISGYIDQTDNTFRMNSNISWLHYKDVNISGLIVNSSGNDSILDFYISSDKVRLNDTVIASSINLGTHHMADTSEFNIYFYGDKYNNHIRLNGGLNLNRDSILVTIKNSELITSDNQVWSMEGENIRIDYSPKITIPLLSVNSQNTRLKILGTIAMQNPEPLRVVIDQTDFTSFEKYIPVNLSMFSGPVNGQVVIYNVLEDLYFDAALIVNPLVYEGEDTLGIFNIYSTFDKAGKNNNIFASLTNPDLEDVLDISGYVDFVEDKDIDLLVTVPNSNASNFYPFIKYLASDLDGTVNATARFYGPYDNYKVDGEANISNAYFTVDYLKTRYHFSDKITMDEKGIYANNIKVYDKFNNLAILKGKVNHDYFNNFNFDLHLFANNFEGLNTTVEDNTIYYGHAFVSGKLDITGPLELMKMDLQARSEKNTELYLIAYDDNTLGNYNFIEYTNKKLVKKDIEIKEDLLSGIYVNLDLEITPDADIQLIFDPNTDDIIKGNGNGNLAIKIDNFYNTTMFGTYTIESGDYTFTALELIKRKFIVKDGSTITWKGDPLDAFINIEAGYQTMVSLNELLPSDYQNEGFRTKVPVEAKLYLTDNLYTPNVKLDFEILSSNAISGTQFNVIDQQVRAIKNDEQELNKQVISLLILNSFLPQIATQNNAVLDNSINANVGSLISSQVSSWVSQITSQFGSKYFEDFQLGVNYQAENKNYQRELDILLSTSLFNNRLKLSGSYDIENINANFQVDYKVLPDSKLRLKVFSRSDNNPIYQQDINRQGMGVFYKEEFDTWAELFRNKNKAYNFQ